MANSRPPGPDAFVRQTRSQTSRATLNDKETPPLPPLSPIPPRDLRGRHIAALASQLDVFFKPSERERADAIIKEITNTANDIAENPAASNEKTDNDKESRLVTQLEQVFKKTLTESHPCRVNSHSNSTGSDQSYSQALQANPLPGTVNAAPAPRLRPSQTEFWITIKLPAPVPPENRKVFDNATVFHNAADKALHATFPKAKVPVITQCRKNQDGSMRLLFCSDTDIAEALLNQNKWLPKVHTSALLKVPMRAHALVLHYIPRGLLSHPDRLKECLNQSLLDIGSVAGCVVSADPLVNYQPTSYPNNMGSCIAVLSDWQTADHLKMAGTMPLGQLGKTIVATAWEPLSLPSPCQRCASLDGHHARSCKKAVLCLCCSQSHWTMKGNTSCTNSFKCANCGGNHAAWNRNCPAREKAKNARRNHLNRLTSKRRSVLGLTGAGTPGSQATGQRESAVPPQKHSRGSSPPEAVSQSSQQPPSAESQSSASSNSLNATTAEALASASSSSPDIPVPHSTDSQTGTGANSETSNE